MSKIHSKLDRLDTTEASLWAQRMKLTKRPCGCKSSAFLMLAALVGWPTWVIVSGIPHAPMKIVTAILVYIAVVVVSAVVGKLAGMVAGRIHYRWLMRHFEKRLSILH